MEKRLNLASPMDEEEIETCSGTAQGEVSSTDRKKKVHLKCEQMRREAIKNGYKDLKELLPADYAPLGFKMTNATILYRAVEFLKQLQEKYNQQQEEINNLKSQLVALQMICQNYEQLTVQHEQATVAGADQSLATLKFIMFKRFMEHFYKSFDEAVCIESYEALTKSMLSWLEQQVNFQCVPDILNEAITKQH